jgi:PAS domain S-box-containing protein
MMRDSKSSEKKPIEEVQAPRPRKYKLERVGRKSPKCKRSEEALKTSELRFRSLIEQTTDAVFCYEYDPPIPTDLPIGEQVKSLYNGLLVECNDVCAKSYGAQRANEVIGRRLTELFKTTPGSLDKLFTALIEGGYRIVDGEGVEKLEDGTERYYLNNGHGVIEDGKLIRVWGTFRDITERKQMEERVAKSEELFSKAFYANPIPATITTVSNDKLLKVNNAWLKLIGFDSEEEAIGKSALELGLWADVEDREERNINLEQRGFSGLQEIKVRTPSGLIQDCIYTAEMIDYESQPHILSMAIDITERKKAEDALRESESRFRELVENIREVFWMENAEGTELLYVSPTYEQVWGRSCESFYENPKGWIEAIHTDDRQRVADAFSLFCETGVYSEEFRIVRPDGSMRWIWDRGVLIRNESGEILRIAGIAEDITQRKRAEEKLRNSEERLKILFEAAPDGIYLNDLEGRFVDGNRAAEELTGYKREELIGKSFIEAGLLSVEQIPIAVRNLKKIASGHPIGPDEYTLKRKDESQVVVEIRAFPVRIGTETLSLGIARDITERKKAESALHQYSHIVSSSTDMLALLNREYIYKAANTAYIQAFNLTSEQLIGHSVSEVFGEKFFSTVIKTNADRCLAGEQVNYQEWFKFPAQGKRFMNITYYPYIDVDNKVHGFVVNGRDVTERKRAEDTLRQSEEKYRKFYEDAPLGYQSLNASGNFLEVNKEWLRILGYSKEKVIGKFFGDFVAPEYLEHFEENFPRFKGSGKTRGTEFEMVRKDKSRITVSFNGNIEYDEEGHFRRTHCIMHDITENKKSQEALQESEEKYRQLVSTTTDAVMLFDAKTRSILDVNKACEELYGYRRDEFLNLKQGDITAEPEKSEESIEQTLEGRIQKIPVRYHKKKDGTMFPVEISVSTFELRGRKILCGAIRDITERKRAEMMLSESERRFRSLSEAAFEGIAFTEKGVLIDANEAFTKIFGYCLEELKGKKVIDLVAPDHRELVTENIRSGYEGIYEHKGLCKDGSLVDLEIQGRSVTYQGRKVRLTAIRDITKSKKTEERLLEYQEQLKSLASQLTLAEERERRRIAIELHDEISQSLFISKMKLEALHKSTPDKKLNDTLDEINNSLGQIIAAMRSLTFDLSSPILYEFGFEEAVAEWLNERVEKKYGIATEFEDDGLHKPLDDDVRVLLFRDVRELLINVVKHAQASKVKVTIGKVGGQIRVSVEDDGLGFEPAKVKSMVTNKEAFGLFSIRERLEHFGGRLEIKSAPDCGCRVTITSPLKREDINKDKQK